MKALIVISGISASNYPSDFFHRLFYPFLLSLILLFSLNWLANKFCNIFEYDFEYARITFWQGVSILLYIAIVKLLW